ncbi:DUF5687 family protein [Flavobacterium sp.]|uniref:DUF5687 family protein n=1 Tax=Flavobacterium sp. TaxID=239 RepID=UPI00262A1892|nr:DUF5687 family protein [Flavobacterium sp.]MDD3004359.1 DUF5687 family protein [Flavobacterium sp.]
MFKKFLYFEWKAFFRSASFGQSLGLKIFLGFFAIYFLVSFLVLGIFLRDILLELKPNTNPIEAVNSYVLLWLLAELVLRFFMQSLPVLNIKPLLVVPIKRSTIINFVLIKSLFSFYNTLTLIIIVPFSISCMVNNHVSVLQAMMWLIAIFCMILTVNYANFLIKKKFADNLKALLPYLIIAITLGILEYFEVFKITEIVGQFFTLLLQQPVLVLAPILLAIGMYFWNFAYLRNNFYLDSFLKTKSKDAQTSDLSWTKRFGDIAPFLQLDLKLILRNKRPKTTVYMSLIILVYGLLFYPNPSYQEMPAMFVFVGIFMTGIFMINFGQFVPAWDSGYFNMMMAQNIPMKQYLASKVGLMTFSIIVLGILTSPYAYFGWNIFWLNLACAIYNLGVNIPMLLFATSFNKKRIDLEKSPFMNYQGTGAAQWLIALPIMVFPLIIWYITYLISNEIIATAMLAIFGVIGLLLRNILMDKIVSLYKKQKYAMINGFKQQEN